MSEIIKKFYNIFWQNKTCQNLFLLSKEELLETRTYGSGKNALSFSTNKIIISNAQDKDSEAFETIKYRTENHNIELDTSIDEKIKYFKPLIEQFFDSRYKKALDKLFNDFDKKGLKLVFKIIGILSDENTRETKIIKLLHDYGFVGKHLNTFKEIQEDFERQLIPAKGSELLNEQTITTFFEGVKFAKELYVNHSYKRLYSTNQILVNTLNSEDDFKSRIKLFHLLYESKIILSSKEDAFIECSHCEPLTYRGVFQLKLNPKKLKDLKCPVCSHELTYFVPYELHEDIYQMVKKQDGLLLEAYCELLTRKGIVFSVNQKFRNNIEIDCIYHDAISTNIVEAKMYKLNTSKEKLKSKIREHFGKLLKDVERLQELPQFKTRQLKPILIVNILDTQLLKEVEQELKLLNKNSLAQNTSILNLNLI